MAVTASFKQQCPSCEAMINVKDSMIGKKIECAKCKDKFIAVRPNDVDDDDADEAPVKKTTKTDAKKSTAVTAKAPGKPAKNEESATASKTNGKPPKNKPRADDDDDDEEDSDKKSKKKKKEGGGVSKLTIGLGLGVLGVVILAVAAFMLLSGGGSSGPGPAPRPGQGGPVANNGNPDGENKDQENPEKDKVKDPKTPPPTPKQKTGPAVPLNDAELARLTNLLPPDTEHVFHVYFKDLLHPIHPIYDAAFQTPGALNDGQVAKKLGFSVLAIDDMICAERHTGQNWKYTILHFKETLKEADLKSALKLQAGGTPIEGQMWYKMAEPNAWLDTLARFRFGISNQLRALHGRQGRPTHVRIHDAQTLIIGDEAPIKALLTARGQFKQHGAKKPDPKPPVNPNPPMNPNPMPMPGDPMPMPMPPMTTTDPMGTPMPNPNPNPGAPMPMPGGPMPMPGGPMPMPGGPMPMPGGQNPNPNPSPAPTYAGHDDFYLTIKPSLKAMLDKMETTGSDGAKVLFSSATDMDANKIDPPPPEFSNTVVRRPRQVWDVTLLLQERKPRIRMLGTSLTQHDPLRYRLRNELSCGEEIDAREFQRELLERSAVTMTAFLKRLTNHEIKIVTEEEKKAPPIDPTNPMPMPGFPMPGIPGQPQVPMETPKEITKSQVTVTQNASTVEFTLDIVPDNWSRLAMEAIANLAASSMRGEAEGAANASLRHGLANSGKVLPEKGLSAQGVDPGQYPPGAFKRGAEALLRTDREPKNRISWMTGLLPYLGHQNLFERVKFDQSWRAPGNWIVGGTLVPEFLDPMYPDNARLIGIDGTPMDFAATHFVGIAGVGLDAANYKRGDPATKHLQGVLGYDESAKLTDISRGQANTILMIQVPHDGVTGVSPWIAGGGATLRGVPEKNSIAPFVLTTDRNGKPIQNNGKRGTYALMSDGSVRFIDQNVSDDVFKAMATMNGPNPEGFNLEKNEHTPLVPAPDAKVAPAPKQPEKKIEPKKVEPEKKAEPKKDEVEKKTEPKAAPPLIEKAGPKDELKKSARVLELAPSIDRWIHAIPLLQETARCNGTNCLGRC
jgi:hypothetical protein